jgi:hypothetical protein
MATCNKSNANPFSNVWSDCNEAGTALANYSSDGRNRELLFQWKGLMSAEERYAAAKMKTAALGSI